MNDRLMELNGRTCEKDFVLTVLPKQLGMGTGSHVGDHGNTPLQIYLIKPPAEM